MNSFHKTDFMTLDELAQSLHITSATLRNKLSAGDDLPESFRVGRRRLFQRSRVNVWLKDKQKINLKVL